MEFDNYSDDSSDSLESSLDEDNPYGDDLEFDSYSDDSSDSLESSLDEDSPYGDDLEFESYADEISDADAYAVSYEDIDEDDEFTLDSVVSTDISDDSGSDADILDSIALLGDLDEDTDADFGFDSEDNALGFDSANDGYSLSTGDTDMFDEDEDIGYDFDDEDDSDYDFDEDIGYDFDDEDEDIGYDFDDEDDSDYEEDAFGFDDIGDDSSDYDDSMYEDVEAGGMYDDSGEDLPDEDDNYFGSYLDDDDEEYFGYDDFQRDTSREYEESEIFSSGSSVEPQTQIINNVQSTSTPSAQSRDSDEVLADALVDGLSKVLKFGKSRLKNSGLLDKDTK